MRRLFVDSFYYIALINPYDHYNQRAQDILPRISGSQFWTTELVLVELADAMSIPQLRN